MLSARSSEASMVGLSSTSLRRCFQNLVLCLQHHPPPAA